MFGKEKYLLVLFAACVVVDEVSADDKMPLFSGEFPTKGEVWRLYWTYVSKVERGLAKGPSIDLGERGFINHLVLVRAFDDVERKIKPANDKLLAWIQSDEAFIRFTGLCAIQSRAGVFDLSYREFQVKERKPSVEEVKSWRMVLERIAKE